MFYRSDDALIVVAAISSKSPYHGPSQLLNLSTSQPLNFKFNRKS